MGMCKDRLVIRVVHHLEIGHGFGVGVVALIIRGVVLQVRDILEGREVFQERFDIGIHAHAVSVGLER
jgi:hypothetical protein